MSNSIESRKDKALEVVPLDLSPGEAYMNRRWQGIPGIERSPGGRLWVTFYSGGKDEGPDNYVLLIKSDDDGATWSDPILAIDPLDKIRAYDSCLWHDPSGRLWLFWAQSYEWYDGRCGVWVTVCDNPDSVAPNWSAPRRISNGIMMNKPTVLSTGEWLLPIAVWASRESELNHVESERYSNVFISTDEGQSFSLLGSADVPNRTFDEHMIIERKDGSLWMLVRLDNGLGQSFSYDRGQTWINAGHAGIKGPNSRFFIRRLQSGRLLLVNYDDFPEKESYEFKDRINLTAKLSDDEGQTWHGMLVLDSRAEVSYPDGVQAENGMIYVVYDHERYDDKEILMAVFTEEDVLSGSLVSPGSRLHVVVNKA